MTAFLLRSLGLVKVPYFSQPNLLVGRRLVTEFFQEEVSGAALGAPIFRERALALSGAWADRDEIDSLYILGATFLAMRRALLALPVCPSHIQVDGNQLPRVSDLNLGCTLESIIEGDAKLSSISAASILAKTCRDAMMQKLDACYPGFKFADHKGYSTPEHLAALRSREPSPLHRKSFSPVRIAFGMTPKDKIRSPAPAYRVLADRQCRAGG